MANMESRRALSWALSAAAAMAWRSGSLAVQGGAGGGEGGGGDPGVGAAEWTRTGERSAGYIADSRVSLSRGGILAAINELRDGLRACSYGWMD